MIKDFVLKTIEKEELNDITPQVEKIVKESAIRSGLCNIYVPHGTAGLIINENADPNWLADFVNAMDHIVPKDMDYLHDVIDNNARAHVKAAMLGCTKTIPVMGGKLLLGSWQDIFLCEFDGPRERRVIVSVIMD
jgi:secondary thiamine-phosphate synthase enzyme